MNSNITIPLDEAKRFLAGRPGLVLGQGASTRTSPTEIYRDLRAIAVKVSDDEAFKAALESQDLASVLDEIASVAPDSYEQFRTEGVRYLQNLKPSFILEKLARIPWSTIISVSLDSCLEEAIRLFLSSKPTQRHVTVVASPTVLGRPALLLPVFKLLGNCRDVSDPSRVALARSEELLKLQEWRQILSPARDFIRDGGLLFLGLDENVQRVRDLLAAIYAAQAPFPSYLLFLESDPCGADAVVQRLASGKSQLRRVNATAQALISALDSPSAIQLQLGLAPTGRVKA